MSTFLRARIAAVALASSPKAAKTCPRGAGPSTVFFLRTHLEGGCAKACRLVVLDVVRLDLVAVPRMLEAKKARVRVVRGVGSGMPNVDGAVAPSSTTVRRSCTLLRTVREQLHRTSRPRLEQLHPVFEGCGCSCTARSRHTPFGICGGTRGDLCDEVRWICFAWTKQATCVHENNGKGREKCVQREEKQERSAVTCGNGKESKRRRRRRRPKRRTRGVEGYTSPCDMEPRRRATTKIHVFGVAWSLFWKKGVVRARRVHSRKSNDT